MKYIKIRKVLIGCALLFVTGCQVRTTPSVPVEASRTMRENSVSTAATEGPTLAVLPTFSPNFTFTTSTSLPPLADEQVFHAWQTQVALATPIRTPVVPKVANEFPRAHVMDGNIYSVNSEGVQEEILIPNEFTLLDGNGIISSPAFVPKTHLLLFNIYRCGPKKGRYLYRECIISLYSFNRDTREIDTIAENIGGNEMSLEDGNFEISPNGQYVSVAGDGHIDIYFRSSEHFKIAYPDAITYYITSSGEYLPKQYWLPDSSGLVIVRAADHESNEPATPPARYVVFRYSIGDGETAELTLDKSIIWDSQRDNWCISPDRNWIVFAGNETGDRTEEGFYYLGNLNDGHTQAFTPTHWSTLTTCAWSADSKHFVFVEFGVIASVDGQMFPVGGHFERWIDSKHYYYTVMEESIDSTRTYIGEIRDK